MTDSGSLRRMKDSTRAPVAQLWVDYWRLYCLRRWAVKEAERLFESN
jgi:hypothetical protein